MTHYLTLFEVLAIHQDLIARFGGTHGIRDVGLLEAALSRPQSGYYQDLIEEAAALWESLSQNHPFVYGNKRTAFATVDVFLRMNGHRLSVDPEVAFEQISEMYETGTFNFGRLEAWLRSNAIL